MIVVSLKVFYPGHSNYKYNLKEFKDHRHLENYINKYNSQSENSKIEDYEILLKRDYNNKSYDITVEFREIKTYRVKASDLEAAKELVLKQIELNLNFQTSEIISKKSELINIKTKEL